MVLLRSGDPNKPLTSAVRGATPISLCTRDAMSGPDISHGAISLCTRDAMPGPDVAHATVSLRDVSPDIAYAISPCTH
eukprot:337338-Rhodomonas_salina.4